MRAIEIIYRFLREKNLYDEFLEFMKKEKGTNEESFYLEKIL